MEDKEEIKKTVSKEIFIRIYVHSIKRDPKCETQASLEEKLKFFERVRITGKELCEEKEWHNAKNLYSRCIGLFKNMPKKQKDSLSKE